MDWETKTRKSFNNNGQFFWDCKNEHPQQTIVLMKIAGQQPGSGHCYERSSQSHNCQTILNYWKYKNMWSHRKTKELGPYWMILVRKNYSLSCQKGHFGFKNKETATLLGSRQSLSVKLNLYVEKFRWH